MRYRLLWVASLSTLAACGSLKAAPDGGDLAEAPADAAPEPEADGGSDLPTDAAARADAPSDARPDGDAACVPACGARACGLDPVCNATCGSCVPAETCLATDAGAVCRAPTIEWEVDGVTVVRLATYEALYVASTGVYSIYVPYWGRSVGLTLPANPQPGTLSSCPSTSVATLTLLTSDNGWADLGPLPARWKNLIFSTCGAAGDDVVTARDVVITSVSPARVAGSYEIVVQGGGPRAGSTLRVRGVFDVTPTTM